MLTARQIAPLFPGAPAENLKANLPLVLAALRQAGLGDAEMVAMAIASVRVEAAGFAPVREGRSKFNTKKVAFDVYEPTSPHGRRKAKDLGNTQPGDGMRYRGTGLPQLTGRYNFRVVGKRLGLPLEDQPELLMQPEHSAAALASFLKRDEAKIRAALRKGDLKAARRLYNGGSHGLDVFERTYRAVRDMVAADVEIPLPPRKPAAAPPPQDLPAPVTALPRREATKTEEVAAAPPTAVVGGGGLVALVIGAVDRLDGWALVAGLVLLLALAGGGAFAWLRLRRR